MKDKKRAITMLLEQLEHHSEQLPSIRTTDWFSENVFSCRSEKTCDYLQEIRDNLHKLNSLSSQSESYRYLLERVEMQLNAFVQAIMQQPNIRPLPHHSASPVTVSSLQRLYQDLAKHHGYEQTLADNLEMAQNAPESSYKAEKVEHCQQRLFRCRQALGQIEDAIREIEEN